MLVDLTAIKHTLTSKRRIGLVLINLRRIGQTLNNKTNLRRIQAYEMRK